MRESGHLEKANGIVWSDKDGWSTTLAKGEAQEEIECDPGMPLEIGLLQSQIGVYIRFGGLQRMACNLRSKGQLAVAIQNGHLEANY
ncbi:hypothetical protein PHYBLDRAFT_145567 [Phycomyces blakesleeanus NRRL 1555(-)]|uniref:Uncharacterized protein n=1 Tax=Phycomyces blakesleeanus (strain ATCC 8743b / DSM 1359 / FGSC 10004 / NBRC 33097 / NRRL 1555) TaxID=763407 RepID=A0A163AFK0_PHYB8|nr:hypothetical protein PHYBLDRAFT_145567 [Phycomyces blakesleeanus NRRL 1555(-)]OAD73161.1 hypothetical protein PHYBLDRAFT_145567 [Phycomyces blakesleeanus NRRL 1555(-)]|eukprot:XP_018291201.1 hypothetical protein PHYBLDRAFT_145567 [Phycomyces blakesleeanus NRRL 1555(-)]